MTNEQLAFQEVNKFEVWMRETIDSIYYKMNQNFPKPFLSSENYLTLGGHQYQGHEDPSPFL